MTLRRSYRRSCAAALAFVCTLLGSPAHADSSGRVHVLSNDEVAVATGRTITEWGDAWWKWAFKHPEVLGDTTGEFGDLGDVRGPVFFAEGSGGDPFRGSVDEDGYGGILPALQGGYWLMLEPLPPGPHHVSILATTAELDPLTGEPTGGTVKLQTQLTLRPVACRHHRYCNR